MRAGQAECYEPFQEIHFYTEIEPINIVYKKEDPSLYNLAVNILAIVGGTVATIGIVNSISHFLFNIKWVFDSYLSFLYYFIYLMHVLG